MWITSKRYLGKKHQNVVLQKNTTQKKEFGSSANFLSVLFFVNMHTELCMIEILMNPVCQFQVAQFNLFIKLNQAWMVATFSTGAFYMPPEKKDQKTSMKEFVCTAFSLLLKLDLECFIECLNAWRQRLY